MPPETARTSSPGPRLSSPCAGDASRGEDTTKASKLSGSAEVPKNLGFPGMLSVRMANGSAD
jgi:hypothetical protein